MAAVAFDSAALAPPISNKGDAMAAVTGKCRVLGDE